MLNFKTLAVSTLALGAVAVTIPAQAAITSSYKVETRIKVADLQTEAGLIKVYNQLLEQAERECASVRAPRLAEQRMAKACAEDLLNDFISSVGNDKLTRMHQEKNTG